MPGGNRVAAMVKRELLIATRNKGRFVGDVIVPIISILIWGMLASARMVSHDMAGVIISIQILWTLVYTYQSYVNVSIMYDVWSREIGNILPEFSISEYVISKVISSFIIVSAISLAILAILHASFGLPLPAIARIILSLPAVWLFSLSVSLSVFGIILAFGRTYDFLSWSVMAFFILLSFPFSIPPSMEWIKPFASLMPMYHAFSIVRGSGSYLMLYSTSVAWLVVSVVVLAILYNKSLRSGMLAEMST